MRLDIPGYAIVAELHSSPFATVYRAVQTSLDRTVLIKVMQPFEADPSMAKRFLREAKTCARLMHPNIIQIFDYGSQNDQPYIIMEFVQGKTLRQLLDEHDAIPADTARAIILDVLRGLSYAHERGVLHRDIKPENIMISDDNETKITDFGLATFIDETDALDAGATVGTPAYMSPEQIRGEKLDQRSDLFSVGAVLFELLTGRSPFAGASIEESLHLVLNATPEFPSALFVNVPEELQNICLKLLNKEANKRYDSAHKVIFELEGGEIKKESDGVVRSQHPKPSRKGWIGAAALLLIAVSVLFWIVRPHRTTQNSQTQSAEEKPQIDSMLTTAPEQNTEFAQDGVQILRKHGSKRVQNRPNSPQLEPERHKNQSVLDEAVKNTPTTGWVKIDVQPWAKVHINTTSYGMTPIESPIELPTGEVVLTLSNPQFGEVVDSIAIPEGDTLSYKFNFNKLFGRLSLSIMPWANIFINDEFVGVSPLQEPLFLKPGVYKIRLENPGFKVWENTVEIKSEQVQEVRVKLLK